MSIRGCEGFDLRRCPVVPSMIADLTVYLPRLLRQDEPRVDLAGKADRDVEGHEGDPVRGGSSDGRPGSRCHSFLPGDAVLRAATSG
jgi:hypothetical protein